MADEGFGEVTQAVLDSVRRQFESKALGHVTDDEIATDTGLSTQEVRAALLVLSSGPLSVRPTSDGSPFHVHGVDAEYLD